MVHESISCALIASWDTCKLSLRLTVHSKAFASRKRNPQVSSPPGNLPCPHFLLQASPCDCSALSLPSIFKVLSSSADVSMQYHMANRRVAIEEARAEGVQTPAIDSNGIGGLQNSEVDNTETIRRAVEAALMRGSYMTCPQCSSLGQKDGACMHITCGRCRAHWCYCCGRPREDGKQQERCRGCDSLNGFIENQPNGNWSQCAIGSETVGYGALYEWHRQVMAYLVRRVKDVTPRRNWGIFQERYPNILMNVPTQNRHILWEELEDATPPVFGTSQPDDRLWKERLDFLPNFDRDEGPPAENTRNEEQDDVHLPPLFEVFKTNDGVVWLCTLALAASLVVLHWTRSDNAWLQFFKDVFVSVASFFGIRYTLLWLTDFIAANPQQPAVRMVSFEVIFCGAGTSPPYLSSIGRWQAFRKNILTLILGSLTIGSFLVGTATNLKALETASRAIGAAILAFAVPSVCFLVATTNYSESPSPEEEMEFAEYNTLHARIFLWTLTFALGVGLNTVPDVQQEEHDSGVVLLCLGIAGATAELSPRIARDRHIHPIWQSPPSRVVRLCYATCMGVTLGSLFIWLGRTEDMIVLRIIGAVSLVIGSLTLAYWYFSFRDR